MQRIGKIGMNCGTDYTKIFNNKFFYSRLDHNNYRRVTRNNEFIEEDRKYRPRYPKNEISNIAQNQSFVQIGVGIIILKHQ